MGISVSLDRSTGLDHRVLETPEVGEVAVSANFKGAHNSNQPWGVRSEVKALADVRPEFLEDVGADVESKGDCPADQPLRDLIVPVGLPLARQQAASVAADQHADRDGAQMMGVADQE